MELIISFDTCKTIHHNVNYFGWKETMSKFELFMKKSSYFEISAQFL